MTKACGLNALLKICFERFMKGNSKTFNKMVNQSGLLEDAEKDWPRFMAMIRSEIVRYIWERDPRTKEYKQARKEENRKQKDEKVATDGQKKDKAAREGLETMEIERQLAQ